MSPVELLAALIVGHAIADYPLQGDFLARAKNRTAPIPGVPWRQALGAHAIMHGGVVGLITGHWWLGILEAALHAVVDDAKCRGKIDFNTDQALHAVCKVAWLGITVALA